MIHLEAAFYVVYTENPNFELNLTAVATIIVPHTHVEATFVGLENRKMWLSQST